MESLGASHATVTQNMPSAMSVTRSQASASVSQSMEADNVMSVGQTTLETQIFSACLVTVIWTALFIQPVTLTRATACVNQE